MSQTMDLELTPVRSLEGHQLKGSSTSFTSGNHQENNQDQRSEACRESSVTAGNRNNREFFRVALKVLRAMPFVGER